MQKYIKIKSIVNSIELPCSESNVFEITLNSDKYIYPSKNAINGETYTLIFIQDSTGGRTVTFGTNIPVILTVNSAANSTTIIQAVANNGVLHPTISFDVVTSITEPGTDTNIATEKALVDYFAGLPGTGTVTEVSVTANNGVTASIEDETSTPAITLGLGDITPNSATITPLSDRQALTIRRNSAEQTNHILDVQTEANGPLAHIDKNGNINCAGITVTQITAALTDDSPTEAEINSATGLTPATAGAGYQATIKDSSGSGLLYKIETDGTGWYYTKMTLAI